VLERAPDRGFKQPHVRDSGLCDGQCSSGGEPC
jgi:hypothetical protein